MFTEISISEKYFTFAKSTLSDKRFQWKNVEWTSVRKMFYFYYTCVTILSFSPLMVTVTWNVIGPHELNTEEKRKLWE